MFSYFFLLNVVFSLRKTRSIRDSLQEMKVHISSIQVFVIICIFYYFNRYSFQLSRKGSYFKNMFKIFLIHEMWEENGYAMRYYYIH